MGEKGEKVEDGVGRYEFGLNSRPWCFQHLIRCCKYLGLLVKTQGARRFDCGRVTVASLIGATPQRCGILTSILSSPAHCCPHVLYVDLGVF